ncbi:ras-related protein Rab-37 isoform X3 [Trichogramma pretiosum]|nr:ras-related protein Rab-37 isoform X3 [Trichogramma pretiosum]
MSDDVFEQDEDKSESIYSPVSFQPPSISLSGSTGYRDYKPPAEVYIINQQSDSVQNFLQNKTWTSVFAKEQNTWETILHKTILLGDSGVGKTSLLVQFDTGKFQHGTFAATVGIGFTNKMILVDDSQVKLQIWDTAGQERFRSVTHAYYRDAHALLLLYDVTNKQSFDNIRAWLGEIREYAQDDVVIMLLGNKCDCGSDRVVRKEDGQRLASEYKVPFMETSAKTGLNVELAFHAVARELKARAKSQQDGHSDEGSFNVHDYLRQHQAQKSDNCFATNCLS